MKNNYTIKIDDGLLYFLKEYHDIDASESMLFFDDRVKEMRGLEPNITENSRRSVLAFKALDGPKGRTVQKKWGGSRFMKDENSKYYVLRGFYPDTNIAFKMTAVYANKIGRFGVPTKGGDFEVVHVKVTLGMKNHWSTFGSEQVDKYREHVTDCILLEEEPKEEEKIEYKYRNFKCMRPKGMELYHEKNYGDKQRELRRLSAKKRREAKRQDEKSNLCSDTNND